MSIARRLLTQGAEMLPEPDGDRGARLREARDVGADVEAGIPRLIGRYRASRHGGGAS